MQHSPNLSTSLFLTYDPKSPDVIGELIMRFRESYNSMSRPMSRESTSLKKSSSDCLKLANQ